MAYYLLLLEKGIELSCLIQGYVLPVVPLGIKWLQR
mgnify:CR=1 FL=1